MARATSASTVIIGFILALASCSRSSERVAPADNGPRARQCQVLQDAPDPAWGNATEKHAHWNTTLSKEPNGETLGVINADWTYWIAGDSTYAHEACVETTGVPKNVAIRPELKLVEFVEKDQRVYVKLSLYVAVEGPAKKDGDRALSPPEMFLAWDIASRPSEGKVEVVKSATAFSPPWDDGRVTAKESTVVVDR